MSHGTGNFGNLANQYKVGRQGVPEEVLDYLWSHLKNPHPLLLDVGCGTGLPSRQLAKRGAQVTGTDISPQMIEAAKEDNVENISYIVTPTQTLPFPNEQFEVVTAFSAFHWFAGAESVQEMRRVLKPGGLVFIVNKNDVGDFREGFRTIFQKYMARELPQIKQGYQPAQILQEAGFKDIKKTVFYASEFFTLDQVMQYFQSVSGWNLVPPESKGEVLRLLAEYAQAREEAGLIERKLEIVTQLGFK